MKHIDQDQVLGIIQNMKEAVRSDRNIDSRDSIELLHQIRGLGRAISAGKLDDPVIARIIHTCSREESLKQFPDMLKPYIPEVAQLVQSQH